MDWMLVEGTVIEWEERAAAAGRPKTVEVAETSRVSRVFPAGTPEDVAKSALAAEYFGKQYAKAAEAAEHKDAAKVAAGKQRHKNLQERMTKGFIMAVLTAQKPVTPPAAI